MKFEDFIEEWIGQENFIRVHTSGSTGEPKEIKLEKSFVTESALRTNIFFHISQDSKLYSCVSPDFIGGKMMAVRALISGAKLFWETPSNQALKFADPNEVFDLVAMVPSQILYLIENKDTLPKIKNLLIGGGAIHPEIKKKISESGFNAFESYGMTETASHIALRKVTEQNIPFQTLPGISVEKTDDSCLRILFDNGLILDTNDLATVVDKNHFYINGRKDQVIISGGRKINPFLIEEKISTLIEVPFCIYGLSDKKWGQRVVLVIESDETKKYNDLKEKISELLEVWEIPKNIYFVKSLPLTSNGKIIRDPSLLPSFENDIRLSF